MHPDVREEIKDLQTKYHQIIDSIIHLRQVLDALIEESKSNG